MKKILFLLCFITSFNLLATDQVNRSYEGKFKVEGAPQTYFIITSKSFKIVEDPKFARNIGEAGISLKCKELTHELTTEGFPILKCTAADGDVGKMEFRIRNNRLQIRITDVGKVGNYVSLIRH